MPSEPAPYGAELYSLLHKLDAQSLDWIAVETPPSEDGWMAIRDRLEHATQS
jgi:L-threonylcarbamoyladenylate synthase